MKYDSRVVKAHGSGLSKVYLVNEAPGPREAKAGFPSYGDQGGNIYRALWRNQISWVKAFNNAQYFKWPKYDDLFYGSQKGQKQVLLRKEFLEIRGTHIRCSNAYDHWPKAADDPGKWEQPGVQELHSPENLDRLKQEITSALRVIYICGECAWNALIGTPLKNPNDKIGNILSNADMVKLNERLGASFELGFYMGHTSKWGKSQYATKIDQVIGQTVNFLE